MVIDLTFLLNKHVGYQKKNLKSNIYIFPKSFYVDSAMSFMSYWWWNSVHQIQR